MPAGCTQGGPPPLELLLGPPLELPLPELLPEPQGPPHGPVQQFAIAVSSDCAVDVALFTQVFSQAVSPLAQPARQLRAPLHDESFAHVCVTLQHCDWTQLAHVAVFRSTPQAAVPPEELLPLLLELLLVHPPLLLPLLPPKPSVSQLPFEELQPRPPAQMAAPTPAIISNACNFMMASPISDPG